MKHTRPIVSLVRPSPVISHPPPAARRWRGRWKAWSTRAIGAISTLLTSSAAANDAEMGGRGTDLVPVKNTVVRMVSEDILLDGTRDRSGHGWRITADYVFENPSDQELDVTMGFPERVCPDPIECGDDQRFSHMKTRVQGQSAKHRIGQVSASHPWSKQFGTVWLYDVHFDPEQVLRVQHSYELEAGGSVAGDRWIDYVTRTGAMWAGPIGEARFTIRLPYPALLLDLSEQPPLESLERRQHEGQDVLELVLHAKNWTPQGDIKLLYAYEDRLLWDSSEDLEQPTTFDWHAAALRSGLAGAHCRILGQGGSVPVPQTHKLFKEMLDERTEILAASDSDLRICRNAIFARHGKIFEDEELNLYFYGAKQPSGGLRRYFIWQPNPDFETRQLFPSDWSTLHAIDKAADLRRSQVAPSQEEAPKTETTDTTSPAPAAEQAPSIPPKEIARRTVPIKQTGCGACVVRFGNRSPDPKSWICLLFGARLLRGRRRTRPRPSSSFPSPRRVSSQTRRRRNQPLPTSP